MFSRSYGCVGRLQLLLLGDGLVHVDQTQEVQAEGRSQPAEQPVREAMWSDHGTGNVTCRLYVPCGHSHATELQAVGVRLMVRGEVVVVEHSDAEHGGVDARTQEEDGEEARHLVDR